MATQLKRPQLSPVAGRPGSRSQRQAKRAVRERSSARRHWHNSLDDERARGPAAGAADASGWAPNGLARDIALQSMGDQAGAGGLRPTTPEAVSSANTAAMHGWMQRISTSMGMSQGKRSSMASLLDPRAGSPTQEDRPEVYCYSPDRSSVMTLSAALTQSAPSLGPGGVSHLQRRAQEVSEEEKQAMLAELDRRVRHATFMRGDAGPRPSSGTQLVDPATSTRTRSLLDGRAYSPASFGESDADRVSFLRANLKPTATVVTAPTDTAARVGASAVQQGLLEHTHIDRVTNLVARMQGAEATGRVGPNPNSNPAAFNPFSKAAKEQFRSSWVVRPAGGDYDEDEEETFSYEPNIAGSFSPTARPSAPGGFFNTPPSPLTMAAERAAAAAAGLPFSAPHRERGDTGLLSAERARKAIAKMKADKKARVAENAAQQEKKKAR